MDLLFQTENLRVQAAKHFCSSKIVVTFQSLADGGWQEGFGASFLLDRRIDAVHVIASGNKWYQYPEMQLAFDALKAELLGYDEVLTYGLSMGGYAAINFSEDCRANRVIAISPQFSVNHDKVPFEHRWDQHLAGISFNQDKIDRLSRPPAKVHAIYDPWNQDKRHIELLSTYLNVDPVHVPFGWHPSTGVLLETGLLPDLIEDLIFDRLDKVAFNRALRVQSHKCAAFHAGLAETLSPSKPRLKVALYRQAVRIAPDNSKYRRDLAIMLLRCGEPVECIHILNREKELDPEFPWIHFHLSLAFQQIGSTKESIESAEAALRLRPDFPAFSFHLDQLLRDPGGPADHHPVSRTFRHLKKRLAPRLSMAWLNRSR